MIDHTIICKIHSSRLSTYVRNELSWRWSCTEILSFLSMKLELLSPLLSDSPFLSSKSFFMFFRFSMFKTQKSRPTFCHVFWGSNTVNKYRNGNCRYNRFLQTCLLRGFTFTFIVRIIVQFLYQDDTSGTKTEKVGLYRTWYKNWTIIRTVKMQK